MAFPCFEFFFFFFSAVWGSLIVAGYVESGNIKEKSRSRIRGISNPNFHGLVLKSRSHPSAWLEASIKGPFVRLGLAWLRHAASSLACGTRRETCVARRSELKSTDRNLHACVSDFDFRLLELYFQKLGLIHGDIILFPTRCR